MSDIRDVARKAGVSVSTVSYAFSGKRPISPKTYRRIMEAVEELDYAPDAGARMLRAKRKNIVALSAPLRQRQDRTSYSDYFIEMASSEHARGYDSLLLTAENGVEDIRRVTRSNLADGVILMDIVHDDIRADQAATYGRPCVALGLPVHHEAVACVDLDFELMGRMAVEAMYRAGRRRLLFLQDLKSEYRRGSGFRLILSRSLSTWCRRYGMVLSEEPGPTGGDLQYTLGVLETMARNRVDGLIGEIPHSLMDTVVTRMRDKGLSIPEDVSVLSCAAGKASTALDRQGISEMPLTPDTLCTTAGNLLTEAIEGGVSIAGRVILQEPSLIDRGSVSAGPVQSDSAVTD